MTTETIPTLIEEREIRFDQACEIFNNAMSWIMIDEAFSSAEWDKIKKKYPGGVEQVWELLDVVDRSWWLYTQDKIKLEDYRKTVKNLFMLVLEIISRHRGKPCLWVLRKKK